jgi:radical SAM superfamily enzyme YgiQ (UPF0313 family)
MARAGFRIVFLGVENVSPRNLKFMQKGQIAEKSRMAIRYLQDSNIAIAGGMIVGNPEDREEDIAANYDFFLDNGVEIYHDQILTPYIQTPLREELLQQGLVTNPDDFRYYSGYWANVRTRHLSSDQIQFLRWKYRGRNMRAFLRRVRPPFRQKKSLLELIYHLIYLPLLELYRKWQNRGKTEQEVYREYIRRTWRRHQFFHDKPPSPHLRILYDDAAVADLHSESETAAR